MAGPGQAATDSATNDTATATIAAVSGKQYAITSVSASFSATAEAVLQIKNGSTVVWEDYIYDKIQLNFPDGIAASRGNAVSAVLAAGGATIVGRVNICAKIV